MPKYYVGTNSRNYKAPDQRAKDKPYYIIGAGSSIASAKRKLAQTKKKHSDARWYIVNAKLKPVKVTKTTIKTKKKRKRRRKTRTSIWGF